MKSLKLVILMLALLLDMAAIRSVSSAEEEDFMFHLDQDDSIAAEAENSDQLPLLESEQPISLRGTSRFLTEAARIKVTCDKYPTVCRAKGSAGKYCCKKKCVNVRTDRLNCGACGKKCRYSEICCKGECVNPSSDRRNCGGCGKKCKKGSLCVHGMCSYS
ncbi:stigma-specific STIG1-like protein 1 [Vitis riparia]|uniref:stigma-specific STIG1-like protein 1 n=1 Tax=Vitis riparia TaxID=96939 RepID=UPI00155AC15A|nr:stigma-specific STIG1-like protein 1 [Vitis riparia]